MENTLLTKNILGQQTGNVLMWLMYPFLLLYLFIYSFIHSFFLFILATGYGRRVFCFALNFWKSVHTQKLAQKEQNVLFGGRLGMFKYKMTGERKNCASLNKRLSLPHLPYCNLHSSVTLLKWFIVLFMFLLCLH